MMGGVLEGMFGFERYEKQDELEEAYGKKFNIDITPYIPLMVRLFFFPLPPS